jgi:hypothetical protein
MSGIGSPQDVRQMDTPPAGESVGPTVLDQTPDSEKVRRCLLQDEEDVAPQEIRAQMEIQADKRPVSNLCIVLPTR